MAATASPPPSPYMRCVTDFWGNCTGVVSNRHAYRWRYVRPGARTREDRESPVVRKNREARSANNEARPESREARPANSQPRPAVSAAVPRPREIRDSSEACHARRRVVGDERPSRDDARRAAENGWMGSVRYDFGERYQDINRAKDVRHICGPSSVSAVLKTPHYRCVVEATPCRATTGTKQEPDERRYERNDEELISRK